MPANPNKRKCACIDCKAWAVKGGDYCASHAGLARGGAPAGNTNALKHGLYSRHFTDDELQVLLNPPSDLADEIALSRVLTGRLMVALGECKSNDELAVMVGLMLRSTATLAKLLQTNKVLTGAVADDLAGSIAQVLDQLGAQWGVKL